MKTHELRQGSAEWKAYRLDHWNASDAPAMMGCSPYKTRTQLLHEMKFGIVPDVDAGQQRRFDDGHRFEALARPLAEKIIGEDLYPVTGSDDKLSASFDGLNMAETIAFEHKSLNDELRAVIVEGMRTDDLPLHYRVQMQQQCMVSGAELVLFMASKWNDDDLVEERHCWYESDSNLAAAITAGWKQFAEDLVTFEPTAATVAAVAAPTLDLPAVSVQVNGSIAIISNLDLFGAKLREFIEGIDQKPDTDQAFANTEAAVKTLEKAQAALEQAETAALAQTADIDTMRRNVKLYVDLARTTRLMLEKIVKGRKDQLRTEIVQAGMTAYARHIASLNERIGKPYMPTIPVDFATPIKGKKNIDSMRDAVATTLANAKIAASETADKIQTNLATLRSLAAEHAFLFPDTAQIVLKAPDDLTALVKSRISEHKEKEHTRLEEERARIRREEEARAEAKVATLPVAAPATAPEPLRQVATLPRAEPSSSPTLRLGQINARIAPLQITADGLASLGFKAAGRDRAAVLYHEADFERIRLALVSHLSNLRELEAA